MKKALITGVTGQDGSYLAEFLLDKGYIVHGIRRRSSSFNTGRIDKLIKDENIFDHRFFLHYGDLTDSAVLNRIISTVRPDEIYNLAAQSHVAVSFETPEYTANADALGTLRILEIIRQQTDSDIKYYQASTSEIFGSSSPPQNELSQFLPRSPYGTSKLFAYWITKNYRDAYGIFASNGILFNHESPRRGETFVTRKIVQALTRISLGSQEVLTLGNINSVRDWGHAKEYVELMWRMLQLDKPIDLVIATGKSQTVKHFINLVASALDMKIFWEGSGINEIAKNIDNKTIIKIDKGYFRPLEVDNLTGDPTLAKNLLNWTPKITLDNLVREMVEHELKIINLNSN
jgi:GDPmannose 4,6-dehydratase